MHPIRTLDQLSPGQQAAVVSLSGSAEASRRLLELGFAPGRAVAALQESPWGDPVAYGVCGAVIALRKADARHIFIEA